jgi:TM2 domain-containing membrane protein YozV
MMRLTTAQQLLVEQRVANDGPNPAVAYLLWLFLWFVSGHRFYLGRPGTAFLQIASYFVLIGFVWLLIDAILIPGMIRERQDEIRDDLTLRIYAAERENPATASGGEQPLGLRPRFWRDFSAG